MITFKERLDMCISLKMGWYLCQYVRDHKSEFSSQAYLEAVNFQTTLQKLEGSPDNAIPLSRDFPQSAAAKEMAGMFDSDYPFYDDAGYGRYWNEVPLPGCVEQIFNRSVALEQGAEPELILDRTGLTDGCCSVSYYDLSEASIPFKSRAAAETFSKKYPTDTFRFETLHNGGWFCD